MEVCRLGGSQWSETNEKNMIQTYECIIAYCLTNIRIEYSISSIVFNDRMNCSPIYTMHELIETHTLN